MNNNNHKKQDNETKKEDSVKSNNQKEESFTEKPQESADTDVSEVLNNPEINNEEEASNGKNENNLLKLEEEIQSLRDEKLRLLAEMENIRKRSEKDKIDSIRYGSMNLAKEILSINDNLSRALESVKPEDKGSGSINNLIDGLIMVQKEFINILNKNGVEKIESMEKKFDHNFHQAVLEIETSDHEEGLVVQEIQSGYTMHDRLLRPAMVGVSKKPENMKKDK
tara:strand:- start:7610 stop:8281 length:672 start_codon:yes stop_codon:yes gene_type:complete